MADSSLRPDANEGVLAQLWQAYEKNRLPHAMIFAGMKGIGAVETAFRLGEKMLQLPIMQRFDEAGQASEDTVWNDSGVFFHVMPVGAQIKIRQVRELQDLLIYTHTGPRLVIIEQAEKMRKESANALLKTLEEPPEGVHFILVVEEQAKLLPTILSRAVVYRFGPMDMDAFARMGREKGWSDTETESLFRLTGGNPGMALEMHESQAGDTIRRALYIWKVLTTSAVPFAEFVLEWGKPSATEATQLIHYMGIVARDMQLVLHGLGKENMQYAFAEKSILALCDKWDADYFDKVFDLLMDAQRALRLNISTQLVGDVLALRLLELKEGDDICRPS